MIQETMSARERFQAAAALEAVDRPPVFPILVTAAPRLHGITQGEAWRNHDSARESLIWCFNEFGYDFGSKPNFYYPMLPGKLMGAPVRNLIPGKQLAEDDLYQIDERVLFPRDHYEKIASLGWNAYWDEYYESMSGKSFDKFRFMQEMSNQLYLEDAAVCESRGMPVFLGAAVDSVMMAFSLCRTLPEFTRDLFEIPDRVEAAMKASCDDLIANAVECCLKNDKKIAFVVLERSSGFYYRPEIFERFEWPFLQRYVDAFLSEGILPWLHFDTDYSLNLPLLLKLPRGSCVCDLDGTTDIFKAKELLGGHMCLSGDVPADLLSIGSPEEVSEYCRRLIDEVGEGGGFMLTTGCECPIDVKPENLRAMVETGKTYQGRKGRVQARAEAAPERKTRSAGPESPIAQAFSKLEYQGVIAQVESALAEDQSPLKVLEACRIGMSLVGEKFSQGEFFLSELMMSAQIFKEVVDLLEPRLTASGQKAESPGRVVMATPLGDIHDLGKNIVAAIFKAAGFEVFDLGVNAPPEQIVEKVVETGARIVAMSALITPTFESMRETVALLEEKGLRQNLFVIIGGGPTTPSVRDHVGADAWTLDPQVGLEMCLEYLARD